MLSKLTSASAPTATLAAIFSIFANRIMLLFVSFLPKMCPQLLKARCLACLARSIAPYVSTAPGSPGFRYRRTDRLAADSTAAETLRNRRSKLKPLHLQWLRAALICRNYGFLDK